MADDLSAIAERIRLRRAAALQNATPPGGAGAYTLTIGSRVFDVLSGYDGTITGAGLRDRLRVNDVRVQLDDSRVVVRDAGEIIARPVQR